MAVKTGRSLRLRALPWQARPRGSEKWFDAAVVVEARDEAEALSYRGRQFEPVTPFRCRTIRPTRRQASLIRECLDEADRLLRAFRLTPARISLDRVHILSPSDLRRIARNDRHRAVLWRGHLYLNARYIRNPADLLEVMTHELAHAISMSVIIFNPRVKSRQAFPLVVYGLRVAGLRVGTVNHAYLALNEVTTEIAAGEMRRALIERRVVTGRDARRLAKCWRRKTSYGPIISTVLHLLAGRRGSVPPVARRLVRCMLTGDPSFVELLKRRGVHDELFALEIEANQLDAFMVRHADVFDKPKPRRRPA
jgi:hypothetical protein